MTSLMLLVGIAGIAALIAGTHDTDPRPQIIYVQTEPTPICGSGCLPVLLLGIVLLVATVILGTS